MMNEEFGCAMQACRKVILHSSFLVLHFDKLSFNICRSQNLKFRTTIYRIANLLLFQREIFYELFCQNIPFFQERRRFKSKLSNGFRLLFAISLGRQTFRFNATFDQVTHHRFSTTL